MKVDTMLPVATGHLGQVPAIAHAAELFGFGALWSTETQHDPFLPLALAAEHTSQIELGTAVAIAFARSPLVTAQAAWDLQSLSHGRFLLGLGTQVRAHIERRFGMPWGPAVPRLREYIQALRSIWHAWHTGERLHFRGQYYQHTLMTPFFNPGPIATPHIPIFIAGVNPGLARLAGELCDGFHVHPFHSVRYLDTVVRPQIAAGAARSTRDPAEVCLAASIFVITGSNQAERERMREAAREQIAFYASTPSYRVVLACHGWEAAGQQLSQLAAAGRWRDMAALVSDEMLEVFAVQAPPDELGTALRERYAGRLQRVTCYMPFVPGTTDTLWRTLIEVIAGS